MAYLWKPTRRPMRPRQPAFHAASCSRCGTGTRRITFRQAGRAKTTPQREGQSVVNRRARAEGWTTGSTWTPVFLFKTCLRLLRPMPPTNALAVLWSGHMGATKAGVCAMQATRQKAKAARRRREACIAWAGGWTAPSSPLPLGPLGCNSPNIAQRHALHVERTAEKAFMLSRRV